MPRAIAIMLWSLCGGIQVHVNKCFAGVRWGRTVNRLESGLLSSINEIGRRWKTKKNSNRLIDIPKWNCLAPIDWVNGECPIHWRVRISNENRNWKLNVRISDDFQFRKQKEWKKREKKDFRIDSIPFTFATRCAWVQLNDVIRTRSSLRPFSPRKETINNNRKKTEKNSFFFSRNMAKWVLSLIYHLHGARCMVQPNKLLLLPVFIQC